LADRGNVKVVKICLTVLIGFSGMKQLGFNQEIFSSGISGTVTEGALKEAIKEAKVTAKNSDTYQETTCVTDDRGAYILSNLPRGKYELIIEKDHHKKTIYKDIRLGAGSMLKIYVTLKPGKDTDVIVIEPNPRLEDGNYEISKEPLTADEIAIYRAVLEDQINNSQSDPPLRLANKTYPVFPIDYAKKLLSADVADSSNFSHKVAEAVILNLKIVLIDTEELRSTYRESSSSIERNIENEYLRLSNIVFDKEGQRALSTYFQEGGRVTLVILKKVDGKWKINRKWTEIII
jgi:hypothetical protein